MEDATQVVNGLEVEFHAPINPGNSTFSISEIEEEEPNDQLPQTRHGVVRKQHRGEGVGEEDVYVAVGKSSSSMDALTWTLKHCVTPSTFVYLVHVFPEVHHIPTPLGKMPRNQVTTAQVESYLDQEREKRRAMLQKFLNLCSASKVKADTFLIESDLIEKAILDLIPVLHIRKMVVGTTKSDIRKASSKAKYIQKNAPDFCKVQIVCEGKEVVDQIFPSPSSPLDKAKSPKVQNGLRDDDHRSRLFSCPCFSSKSI